jgi:hypothetical protein
MSWVTDGTVQAVVTVRQCMTTMHLSVKLDARGSWEMSSSEGTKLALWDVDNYECIRAGCLCSSLTICSETS